MEEFETLTLTGGKKLSMTKVESVDGFSEQFIKLTVNKKRTVITGDGLKITVFNKSSGELVAEGDFYDIKFEGEKAPLIKRLFK